MQRVAAALTASERTADVFSPKRKPWKRQPPQSEARTACDVGQLTKGASPNETKRIESRDSLDVGSLE